MQPARGDQRLEPRRRRSPNGSDHDSSDRPWTVRRRGAAGAVMDGRQVTFPGRLVQDRDQQHEPVVDGVAIPESLNGGYPAREGRGSGRK